jgi:hypothetical protein
MKFWFQNHELKDDVASQVLLMRAVENGSLDIIKYLEQGIDVDWKKIIVRAMGLSREDIARYALDRAAELGLNLNSVLIQLADSWAFSVVLAEPSSHPESNLRELVDSIKNAAHIWRGQSAKSLILDSRIKTEDLEPYVVRSIFDSLLVTLSHGHMQDAMDGYRLGTEISGYSGALTADTISGTDAYSLVLRQMVFKRPKKEELMDWMLDMKLEDVIQAAACVLDDKLRYSDGVAPLRALLLSILYPSMNLEESIMKLGEDGYRGRVLHRSGGLLGVYYSLPEARPIDGFEDKSDSPSEVSGSWSD